MADFLSTARATRPNGRLFGFPQSEIRDPK